MLKKKILKEALKIILTIIFLFNFSSPSFSETIIFSDCKNSKDGFKKNEYIIDLDKSLMTRNFTYDKKTYNKYRLTDITTKKNNTLTRFIYSEGSQIFSEKMGYPQFYTQLLFNRNDLNIKIKTVINNETGISNIAKCKKIEIFETNS
tara:strand:- start:930 stop:1373 length:444 start_codon:yes stop_codon:yes gene_type:complete